MLSRRYPSDSCRAARKHASGTLSASGCLRTTTTLSIHAVTSRTAPGCSRLGAVPRGPGHDGPGPGSGLPTPATAPGCSRGRARRHAHWVFRAPVAQARWVSDGVLPSLRISGPRLARPRVPGCYPGCSPECRITVAAPTQGLGASRLVPRVRAQLGPTSWCRSPGALLLPEPASSAGPGRVLRMPPGRQPVCWHQWTRRY